jgi:hypothetical protein
MSFEEKYIQPVINALKPIIEKRNEIQMIYEKIKDTSEWGFFCPTHGWVEAEEGDVYHYYSWIDDEGDLNGIRELGKGTVCKICHNPEGVFHIPMLDYNSLKNVIKYGEVYSSIINETVLGEDGSILLDKKISVPEIENVIKMLSVIKKVYELFRSLRMRMYVKKSDGYNVDDSLYNLIEKAFSEISSDEIESMTEGIAKFNYTITSALFKAGISLNKIDDYELIDEKFSIVSYDFFVNCNDDFIIYERKVIVRKNSDAREKFRKILNEAAEKYRNLEKQAYENKKKNPPEVPFIAQWSSGRVYIDPYRRVVLLSSDKKYIDDEIIVLNAELMPSRKDPSKNYWFARKWTTRKLIYEEALKNCR